MRIELDDGNVLLVAASWEEGCHVVVDPPYLPRGRGGPRRNRPSHLAAIGSIH